MSLQESFDADLRRAMSRRQFLTRLTRASSAAILLSSPLGCGKLAGGIEHLWFGEKAPPLDPVQRKVVAKIIDGFNPPDTEIRQRLAEEDPDYDPVDAYIEFAYASGDEFLANMRFLIDFVNILPTFTRTFSTRYHLPAHLALRWFHADDANRYFLFLRDSSLRALRNIFTGAKFIGTAPIYTNEKVAWKFMRYPGPWLVNPAKPDEDRAHSTSFNMARETDENVAELRRGVVRHDALREGLKAARVVGGSDRLVLETDVVVVGSGAGGSFVAAELAAKTKQRVLVLDKGDFIEPTGVPAARAAHDAAHLRHGVLGARDLRPVDSHRLHRRGDGQAGGRLRHHQSRAGLRAAPARDPRLARPPGRHVRLRRPHPHLEAIRTLLRIAPVSDSQISGSNLMLRRGVEKLGMSHHGPTVRNAHQCIGCGYCDLGCRYNRKLTPLNMVLPMAARSGAQVVANCRVDELLLEQLPGRRARRTHAPGDRRRRVSDGLARQHPGSHRDPGPTRGAGRRAVLLAAHSHAERRAAHAGLQGLGACGGRALLDPRHHHVLLGLRRGHLPSAATPPMGYFVKKYDVEDQEAADPARDQVRYALEGMLNHPLAHAQLMPYESAESHQAFMKRFNQTMTLAVMFRDRPVGRVTPHGFEYALAEEDHAGWLDSLRTGARIMFAAGGRRVFFNSLGR